MAWNEPGKGNQKDPWGSNGGNQQPPDLDEVLRNLHRKLSSLLGIKKPRADGPHGGKPGDSNPFAGLPIVAAIFLVLYLLAGIFIVKPAEKAVIFQFGKYQSTVGSGPHWIARFIQSKAIVNVDEVTSSQHQALMLTKDQNIVSVELGVQYKKGNIEDYLFNVRDPEATLEQVTDSAVRQVVGHSTLDDILTSGREQIRQGIKKEVIRMLSQYNTGLDVVDVAMQPAKAPDEVKEAFDDAIKAQEDEVREINQARAYEKQKVPIAEGQAQRRILEAEAYKTNVVLQSQGDTQRFLKLLPEYQRNPKVTRQRLYLSTMEALYGRTNKVFIDTENKGNQLFYLPVDKLMNQRSSKAALPDSTDSLPMQAADSGIASNSTNDASVINRASNDLPRENRWRSGLDVQTRDSYTR